MSDEQRRRSTRSTRVAIVLVAATIAVLLPAGMVAAGFLTVAMADAAASPDVWQRWGDIGAAFGVLNGILSGIASIALLVTLWLQYRELGLQRNELRLQRDAIAHTNLELRRSADASLRSLHFELVKLSIADPALAVVWPDAPVTDDPERQRQLVYANLIFQHLSLSMLTANRDDEQIRETLRYAFTSPIMREYWSGASAVRRLTQKPGTWSWRVAGIADEVCGDASSTVDGPG